MENKKLSMALFALTLVLALITAYFFYGMLTNGAPKDLNPDQMGAELITQKKAVNSNYAEKGQEAYELQVNKIESNILNGVNYMTVLLFIAGILMVVFLLWGVISTLINDFKKGIPALIFIGITALAFIWAYLNSTGSADVTEFGNVVKKFGEKDAGEMVSQSNFWVSGLLFVLIPGAFILLVDLVVSIVKGYTK